MARPGDDSRLGRGEIFFARDSARAASNSSTPAPVLAEIKKVSEIHLPDPSSLLDAQVLHSGIDLVSDQPSL